jgi:hypothetical protein
MCADITKCGDTTCKAYEKCYRAQAKDNDLWQSYYSGSPRQDDNKSCDMFWPIDKYTRQQLDKIWED